MSRFLLLIVPFCLPTWCLLLVPIQGKESWPGFGGPERNFVLPAAPPSGQNGKLLWRRSLGWGAAGIVSDGPSLFTVYAAPIDSTSAQEFLVCLDRETGEERWLRSWAARFRGEQQIHQEPIQPLATPLLHASRLLVLSFDGILRCLAPIDGELLWEVDLVERFGATPLQYGFASSPIARDDQSILVAAGGSQTHLVALNVETGETLWQSAADEPAYATPVIAELLGQRQVILLGRDAVYGYDLQTGATLWREPLANPGQTNVPTPLVLPGDRLLVSGQGCSGTRCWQFTKDSAGQPTIKELWHTPRSQFFYCNWIVVENRLCGFDSSFLVAIDLADGRVLWKSREQTDANLVQLGEETLALRGDGLLSIGKMTERGFEATRRLQALDDFHCWTPPTVIKGVAYVRNGQSIAAVELAALSTDTAVPPPPRASAIDAALEQWSSGSTPEVVSELTRVWGSEGRDATLARYQEIRSEQPERLTATAYQQLLAKAEEASDSELAIMLSTDWTQSDPRNIAAYETLVDVLQRWNRADAVESLDRARLVEVNFVVETPPNDTYGEAPVYLTGNCRALGNWQPNAVPLARGDDGLWKATLRVPTGDLEFKATRGSWESTETDAGGADRANRRVYLSQPTRIELTVSGWKP